MQFIPTNDCFHHLLRLLRIHKDKELVIEIFASQGLEVSKSMLRGWETKTGVQVDKYRHMPREALDAFIVGLYQYKLVTE